MEFGINFGFWGLQAVFAAILIVPSFFGIRGFVAGCILAAALFTWIFFSSGAFIFILGLPFIIYLLIGWVIARARSGV